MIINNIASSKVFGGADIKMESTLKNPNQFKEAVIYESLNSLPTKKINEFVHSEEAKTMLNEGIISQDVLDRLVANSDHHNCKVLKTTVCHMAKENGDPIWDEFVKARIQERRLLNDLIEKYGKDAKVIADSAEKDIVKACIPEYFR